MFHKSLVITPFILFLILAPTVGAIEITQPEIGSMTVEVTDYTFPEAFEGPAKHVNTMAGFLVLIHSHWNGSTTTTNVYYLTPLELLILFTLNNPVGTGDVFVAADLWTGQVVMVTAGKERPGKSDPFTVDGFEAGSTEITIGGLEPGTELTSVYTSPGGWPTRASLADGSWGDQDGEENGQIVTMAPRYRGPSYVLPGEVWVLSVNGDQAPAVVTLEAEGTLARHVVPAVSHIIGASGTPFISDLTLANPMGFEVSGWIRFLEDGATIENAPSADFTLQAGESKTWTDVLQSAFGITANVKGSLVVGGYPHWLLQVSSRNYAVDDEDRRFGIALPGQPTLTAVIGPNPWIMPGLVQNDEFRSNLVLAGLAPTTSTVAIRIIEGGVVKAETTREIPPYALVQINRVAQTLGAGTIQDGHIELMIEEGGIAAAISVVDGSADDAAYITARPLFPY